ncbi:tetratricopeptide repeat protein [Roseinatronobacter sp. S2]|uniref:tetratricopeptide repeat protein n=1 Tax=Roseinatronobacter sp. S2 TaxID=3035471 RepID=UPI00240F690B|nr:tetratricopeptide repeat protein [Roseinatronobacter sp. S2]WFE73598.1 tetratricopeptide repeat protein [Roseinatronobacter sp. S2]
MLISAIAALLAIVGAVFVGARWLKHRIKPAAPQVTPVQVMPNDGETKLTIIDFIRIRRELRAEIMAELDRTDASERAQLQARIDELTAQINNPEGAFETERKRLADLEARLVREGNELGAERLQSAIDALRMGNTDQAKDIFIEIAAREELAVKRAARAEFGLGEIAEGQKDWTIAANHYTRAAELDSLYSYSSEEKSHLWMLEDSQSDISKNKIRVTLSVEENGLHDPQTATSINNYALSLVDEGRYGQAEPLFREALEIRRKTLGNRHPAVGQNLNNLAGLLRATGRFVEAEPMYREALAIGRETLGDRHPDVATWLNNLAGLLHVTDRANQATPLYLEALSIHRTSLGDDHPATQTTAQNTLIHLRQYAPDHPDLAGLLAVFGDGG